MLITVFTSFSSKLSAVNRVYDVYDDALVIRKASNEPWTN